METLKGLIADFSYAMVAHKDTSYFSTVRSEIIELTVEHSELAHLEVLFGGYDDDTRSVYEVPEVNRWINLVCKRWPDAMFWLTPTSLWVFSLSLNPDMHSRLPDGRIQIAIDVETLLPQIADSHAAGVEALVEAGMAQDAADRVEEHATENIKQMLERKKFGEDYAVVHPKDGTVFIYRKE